MGVPYFFGWLLRKYKKHNMIIQNINKKVDTLYLDSNCLFHPQCFKVLDLNENLTSIDKLEKKMFNRILKYIDFLIDHCNPQKEVFISVDGVAPLAKMNQQRKRRFRSVQDKILFDKIKKKYNKEKKNNWSNTVITPGTEFMEKLNNEIITHFKKKKSNLKITLSSYHVPGEGEHKILDDIRNKNNDENVYVIYGLDADLIFLSMASQKNNIYLLREETEIKKKNPTILEDKESIEEELIFVSIDEMKKSYINKLKEIIITSSNNKLIGYNFNNKNLINDFIVICFLLGNDFLPHIPSINIRNYGLDNIINAYVYSFIKTKQYIFDINRININMKVLLTFLQFLNKKEYGYFKYSYPKYKERIKKIQCRLTDDYEIEMWNINNMKNFDIKDPIKLGLDNSDLWKFRYYEHHFNCKSHQKDMIEHICKNYFDGFKWVLLYYFKGCNNWTWQYNYTHGPFISDLYNYLNENKINLNEIKFDNSIPSKPFVQLLSVLPPQCDTLLPKSYKKLVNEFTSPIIDYYPLNIELDLLDHKMYWECIPLLPIVNIDKIKNATKNLKLNNDEKIRNCLKKNVII
jgi:5'-3' exoribonuclease 2